MLYCFHRVVANDRAGIEAAGTWAPRALGHLLFSKKRKTPLGSRALGQMLVSKKQSWALGHSGTQALIKKLSKDYQKDYPKTIKKIICNDLYT